MTPPRLGLSVLIAALAFPALLYSASASADKLISVRFTQGPAWNAAKAPNDQVGMRDHSANLGKLRAQGHIVFGARYGDTGLVVFRAADDAAVLKMLEPDPTLKSGVFKIQVDPFRPFYHGSTNVLTSAESAVLRVYLDALNRMDADLVLALCADGFTWYSVQGDKLVPEVQGLPKLREWLTGYFRDVPTARTEFLSMEQTGPFLTVRERATWQNKDGAPVAQTAIGVYEVRDGLLQRIWYYPPANDAPQTFR